ncbi:helix-turn-helix domain-containing protein [Streptomyces sp. NPDC088789]|uniref:helix-turn-helix domain-containing protein n=1 Tax=Streptomyces sp. NPDC088789 TaxID=3365899 RepID=UPI00381E837B
MAAEGKEPSILGFPCAPELGAAAHRKALAGHLRRCRDHAGIAPRQAARCLGTSTARITRIEKGQSALRPAEVGRLLDSYGATDPLERTRVDELLCEADRPEPWQDYANVAPPPVRPLLGMEPAARRIISYEPQLVPGWLQTAEYADTVIRAVYPTMPGRQVAERVALRTQRIGMLRRDENPPVLLAVMDSEVLCRKIGTPGVMYRQIEHLLALLEELPFRIRLQIAQLSAGAAGAIGHPVVHLRFHTPDYLPDMVYLEQYEGAQYREKPAETERYQAVLNNLCWSADPAGDTPGLLKKALAFWRSA